MTFSSSSFLRTVAICCVFFLAVSLEDVVDEAIPTANLNLKASNDFPTNKNSNVKLSIFPADTNPEINKNVTAQQLTTTNSSTTNSTTNSTIKLTINPFGTLESPNPNLSLLPNTGRFPIKNTTGVRGPKLCRPSCSSVANQEETDAVLVQCNSTNDMPRFLFAGQSNMVGRPNHASPKGQLEKIVRIVNEKFRDPLPQTQGGWRKRRTQVISDLHETITNGTKDATNASSWNEATLIYEMAGQVKETSVLNPQTILAEHPFVVCSLSNPKTKPPVDCERPVSPTACGLNQQQFGPEFMFAHHFGITKAAKFGITKVAKGGTKIGEWLPNSNNTLWLNLVDNIRADNGSIEAFFWFQGENDLFPTSMPKQEYLDSLTRFIRAVRSELFEAHRARWGRPGSPTARFATPLDIPVVIVELGAFFGNRQTTNRGEAFPGSVVSAQREFVASDTNAALVNTGTDEDPSKRLSWHLHFDVPSQLIIGHRMAEAFQQLLER